MHYFLGSVDLPFFLADLLISDSSTISIGAVSQFVENTNTSYISSKCIYKKADSNRSVNDSKNMHQILTLR